MSDAPMGRAADPEGGSGVAPAGMLRRLILPVLLARFGQLAAFSLFINLLSLAVPVFVLQVYDRVVFYAGLETLKGLVIAVLIAIAFDFVLRQARSRLVQMIALRIDIGLTRELFSKLTALPLRRLETQSDAEWRVLLRDADTLRDTVAGPSTLLLVDLPFVAVFLAVIWIVAPPIAWILLLMVPGYMAFAVVSSLTIGRSSRAEQDAAIQRDVLVGQMIDGRATVKALGLAPYLRDRWDSLQAVMIDRSLARGARSDRFANLGQSITVLTTVVLTSFGAVAIVGHEMTMGGLIAANMLAARVVQPLAQLVSAWRNLSRLRQSAARLGQVLSLSCDRQESDITRDRPRGDLTLDAVSFRYDGVEAAALSDVSLVLRPGGLHGLVGPNGSGKTTLLKLMQGLYPPAQGRVLLDHFDIAHFGAADLARWIGYVPQDPFFLSGSLRDNIAKGRTDLADELILAAARRAGIEPLVAALPQGFDSDIGEGGRRLSTGQRQRLALARALVDDPPVLLLDEPSANLDPQAEQELAGLLRELSRERNVVVVTHSRTLLAACSNVIALNQGHIALAGPSAEVLPRLLAPVVPRAAREVPAA